MTLSFKITMETHVAENEFKFKKLVVGSDITRQLNLKTNPTKGHTLPIVINQLSMYHKDVAYPTRMFASEEDVCGLVSGDIGNYIVIWSTGTVKCVAQRKHISSAHGTYRYVRTSQLDKESVIRLNNYLQQVEIIMTERLQELTSTDTIVYTNEL